MHLTLPHHLSTWRNHRIGNLPLPNLILITIFGLSPSTFKICTTPFFLWLDCGDAAVTLALPLPPPALPPALPLLLPFPLPLPSPFLFGSRLCLLPALSPSAGTCSFLFLLSPSAAPFPPLLSLTLNCRSLSDGRRNLTILLRFLGFLSL